MDQKQIKDTAKKHTPKHNKLRNVIVAFLCGGVFAIIGQALLHVYMNMLSMDEKEALSLMIVTFIFVTSVCTGLGIYDKFAQFFGAGMFIPISGFANSLTSSALECRSEGPIYGIGSNMFKLAGSVITYGIVSAFVFGAIRFLLFGA